MLFAGTSGFSYAGWKGKFYPKQLAGSKMLGYYAERLNGVELNGSFYRTPPETTLAKWAAETPPGFRFCMKANRGLTYSAEGFDRVGLARIFSGRIALLGERLGPVLLQFPPTRQKNVALLDSLLGALARPAAVEFRHPTWDVEETYEVLARHGAAYCVMSGARLPCVLRATAPFVYVRMHGPDADHLYAGSYSDADLSGWARASRLDVRVSPQPTRTVVPRRVSRIGRPAAWPRR